MGGSARPRTSEDMSANASAIALVNRYAQFPKHAATLAPAVLLSPLKQRDAAPNG